MRKRKIPYEIIDRIIFAVLAVAGVASLCVGFYRLCAS
jgi:hypothetical protein